MATLTYRKKGKRVKNLVSYILYRRLFKLATSLLFLQSLAFLAFLNKYIWKYDIASLTAEFLKYFQ